jgi:hypothetical protein
MTNALKDFGLNAVEWRNIFLQTGLIAVWLLIVIVVIKVTTWLLNIPV